MRAIPESNRAKGRFPNELSKGIEWPFSLLLSPFSLVRFTRPEVHALPTFPERRSSWPQRDGRSTTFSRTSTTTYTRLLRPFSLYLPSLSRSLSPSPPPLPTVCAPFLSLALFFFLSLDILPSRFPLGSAALRPPPRIHPLASSRSASFLLAALRPPLFNRFSRRFFVAL